MPSARRTESGHNAAPESGNARGGDGSGGGGGERGLRAGWAGGARAHRGGARSGPEAGDLLLAPERDGQDRVRQHRAPGAAAVPQSDGQPGGARRGPAGQAQGGPGGGHAPGLDRAQPDLRQEHGGAGGRAEPAGLPQSGPPGGGQPQGVRPVHGAGLHLRGQALRRPGDERGHRPLVPQGRLRRGPAALPAGDRGRRGEVELEHPGGHGPGAEPGQRARTGRATG